MRTGRRAGGATRTRRCRICRSRRRPYDARRLRMWPPYCDGAAMSVLMVFRVAFKALGRNKMRTALTMLGMIIGVSAVITMVALGTGAQSSIETQIQAAGTNMIMVSDGNFQQCGVRQGQCNDSTLAPDDAMAIRDVPGVQYIAPGVNTRGQVVAGNMNW